MKDYAVAAYLTTKGDPQRKGKRYPSDSDQLIAPWADGLRRCNMTGIILHDDCPQEFIERHENEHLTFRQVTPGRKVVNVDRFYHYLDLAREVSEESHLLFTDLFDVTFNNNPFPLMWNRPEKVFAGVFERFSPMARKNWSRQAYGDPYLRYDLPYLAATLIGGRADHMICLLVKMTRKFDTLRDSLIVDMPVTHNTIWENYPPDEVFYGSPLHGDLKGGHFKPVDCVIHLRDQREDHGIRK